MLKVEQAAAQQLGRRLQQLLWKKMSPKKMADHPSAQGFEYVIAYVLFLRAERTFSSVRTLARLRMVDDAFSLVRTLVEKVINAEYILLSGTETALDYIQYHSFREWRDFEEFQKTNPEVAPNYTAEFRKLLQEAHNRAKTKTMPDGSRRHRFGRGNDWIDMGLSKRAEAVDEAIRKKFSMKTFKSTQVLYHMTYKQGAAYLHGMWVSLARSLETKRGDSKEDADGMCEVEVGIRIKDKDPRVAYEALNSANLAALYMILFLGRVFGTKDDLDWATRFKEPYLENQRRARKPPES
jgi:hypothetical protein